MVSTGASGEVGEVDGSDVDESAPDDIISRECLAITEKDMSP